MSLLSSKLKLFINKSLHPQKFSGKMFAEEDFEAWRCLLSDELSMLQLCSISYNPSQSQDRKRVIGIINGLADLNNIVYHYLTKLSAIWRSHSQSAQIRQHYKYTCQEIEKHFEMLCCNHHFDGARIKLSAFRTAHAKMQIRQQLSTLTVFLNTTKVESGLIKVVNDGIKQLCTGRILHLFHEKYINQLINLIQNSKELTTRSLMDLMIVTDFDIPLFFSYCAEFWKNCISDRQGLHEQLEFWLSEKENLREKLACNRTFLSDTSSKIGIGLDHFLSEKVNHIKKILKIKRAEISDAEQLKADSRFLINLPVPQLALFIRMQMEKGLLPKDNIGEFFRFIAAHFYTKHALFISAESLQKKSTDVEFSNAQKLKAHLIGMLNWLNSNFNLSNYN